MVAPGSTSFVVAGAPKSSVVGQVQTQLPTPNSDSERPAEQHATEGYIVLTVRHSGTGSFREPGSAVATHMKFKRRTVSRLQQAADPALLQSQEVFSDQLLESETPDVEKDAAEEGRDGSTTDSDSLEPYPANHLAWVPIGDPITDDETHEELPRMFYFFLSMLNLTALRSIARDMKVKRYLPKHILLARVFLTFMKGYRNGETELGLLLSA